MENILSHKDYVADMEYEYAGMINALRYLSHEARDARLELVSLHLNIAIEELQEYRLPTQAEK